MASPDECQGILGSVAGYTTPVACIHPSGSSVLWKETVTYLSSRSKWRVSTKDLKLWQWRICTMNICATYKALPSGIPVSGQWFSVAMTQAGGYLAT